MQRQWLRYDTEDVPEETSSAPMRCRADDSDSVRDFLPRRRCTRSLTGAHRLLQYEITS